MNTWVKQIADSDKEELLASMQSQTPDKVKLADNDPLYAVWLGMVDQVLMARLGVPHDGLDEWAWHDAYVADLTPFEAIHRFAHSDEMNFILEVLRQSEDAANTTEKA